MFECLHVDAHCIVALKPSGTLSVPGLSLPPETCLYSQVLCRHDDARVVHRLDMATSGLIVFARGLEAQRRLNRAFAERQVTKRYVARVAGTVVADAGEIDLALAADWPRRPRQKVDHLVGKPALTRYRVLARDPRDGWTRVELEPVTGRSHQLRVHMQALGHPILGDALYAPPDVAGAASRLMLHAETLSFTHPASAEPMTFHAAAPF